MDAGVGPGKDIDNIYTWNSGNRSLFIDTHTSPSNFYDGSFSASQFTGTIDATHAYNVGLASPLTVAVGLEAREDTYAIGAGDADSYYKEGAQSFPGFTPSAAGDHSRKNYAGYIDLAVAPIEQLQIDVAGRAEHYTDFGDTQIEEQITARATSTHRGRSTTAPSRPASARRPWRKSSTLPSTSRRAWRPCNCLPNSAAAKVLGLPDPGSRKSPPAIRPVSWPCWMIDRDGGRLFDAVGNRIASSSTVNNAGGHQLNAAAGQSDRRGRYRS